MAKIPVQMLSINIFIFFKNFYIQSIKVDWQLRATTCAGSA